jgi:hypothetical protein
MNKTIAGVLLAVVQIGIVGSLGAKLLWDRARYPHVWVKTASYDPNLFIRGRYVSLQLVMPLEGLSEDKLMNTYTQTGDKNFYGNVRLEIRNDELVAVPDKSGKFLAFQSSRQVKLETPKTDCPKYNQYACDYETVYITDEKGRPVVTFNHPSLFFIPENAADPTRRPAGEELWVDATITPHGIPRPIRLGVKKDGKITPLNLEPIEW